MELRLNAWNRPLKLSTVILHCIQIWLTWQVIKECLEETSKDRKERGCRGLLPTMRGMICLPFRKRKTPQKQEKRESSVRWERVKEESNPIDDKNKSNYSTIQIWQTRHWKEVEHREREKRKSCFHHFSAFKKSFRCFPFRFSSLSKKFECTTFPKRKTRVYISYQESKNEWTKIWRRVLFFSSKGPLFQKWSSLLPHHRITFLFIIFVRSHK